jgi:hypothetical protein
MEAVKTIWNSDRTCWMTIYREGSRFTYKAYFDTTGIPGGEDPNNFADIGGVYDSIETAEREARLHVWWLRQGAD